MRPPRTPPVERASGLSRAETWLVHAATVTVGLSGLAYAWFRYVAAPADPYAVVNHPWQPATQHLHVLAAPLLVFAAGLLWRPHVAPGLRRPGARSRRSGLTLTLAAAPMIASGYLLQVAAEAPWRRAWGLIHTGVSIAWLAGMALHLSGSRSMQPKPGLDRSWSAAGGREEERRCAPRHDSSS